MGAVLSRPVRENPRSNLVLAAVVVFWLTKWLNSRVDRRHNPAWYEGKKDGDAEKGESDEKKSGMQRSMSLTEMAVAVADASSRSTRLKRARELNRSTPKSYAMAAKSFLDCGVAIGVLDVLFARRCEARFFALHALSNAIVTLGATPDMIRAIYEPATCMQGRVNVVPAYQVLALFVYHVLFFKNVGWDDWWHHLLFGVGIGGVGLHYCPGPLCNALCFFISGFPGGIDYAMLAMVKDKLLKPTTEKIINAWLNAWCRGPGLTIVGYMVHVAARSKQGGTNMSPWAAICVAALSIFNGNYYSTRVVASAGANRWRPS